MARKQTVKDFSFSTNLPDLQEGTPEILRKYRHQAWESYQGIPFPSRKEEAWRRTSLRDLNLMDLQLSNGKKELQEISLSSGLILSAQLLSNQNTVFLSPHGVQTALNRQRLDQGVIISDLIQAGRETPDQLQKVLGRVIDPREGKFAAATAAFGKQGVFIYIPRGVRMEAPLYLLSSAPEANTAAFSQILVYLEEGSSLSLIHETHSPTKMSGQSLTGEILEVYVGNNAALELVEFQTLGNQVWSVGHKKALVDRDGTLDWKLGDIGSHLTKHFISVDLVGEGAEGRISGLFFGSGDQHLSYNTLQRHLAPRTNSDLLFKGGLTGKSRSVWRGMIYVAPGAQYIDGYQANRNLILSDAARSDSIPGLEILNNDVRCTHGSTVGKIDPEQLFYLLSRGIPEPQAEQIIIQGFFNEILNRIQYPALQEQLWQAVEQKIF